jgi:hypothetical protein
MAYTPMPYPRLPLSWASSSWQWASLRRATSWSAPRATRLSLPASAQTSSTPSHLTTSSCRCAGGWGKGDRSIRYGAAAWMDERGQHGAKSRVTCAFWSAACSRLPAATSPPMTSHRPHAPCWQIDPSPNPAGPCPGGACRDRLHGDGPLPAGFCAWPHRLPRPAQCALQRAAAPGLDHSAVHARVCSLHAGHRARGVRGGGGDWEAQAGTGDCGKAAGMGVWAPSA